MRRRKDEILFNNEIMDKYYWLLHKGKEKSNGLDIDQMVELSKGFLEYCIENEAKIYDENTVKNDQLFNIVKFEVSKGNVEDYLDKLICPNDIVYSYYYVSVGECFFTISIRTVHQTCHQISVSIFILNREEKYIRAFRKFDLAYIYDKAIHVLKDSIIDNLTNEEQCWLVLNGVTL